jgi:molybdate transport system ATP-binding protein
MRWISNRKNMAGKILNQYQVGKFERQLTGIVRFFYDKRIVIPPTSSEPLFIFDHATAVRVGGEVAIRDLTWTVREGETWAIVGPTGSGKTALTETLLGRHRLASGSLSWPLVDRLDAASAADIVQCVAFKEDSWLFSYSRHYYQQRFNFIEAQDDLTLDEFLHGGRAVSETELQTVAERLEIAPLRKLSLIKLSNGQMRRARIAKALVAHPQLLILDDPFMGLDAAGRDEVAGILGELIRQGARVLLVTGKDSIPDWVTHVLEMDSTSSARCVRKGEMGAKRHATEISSIKPAQVQSRSEPIIELRDVTVRYDDSPILDHVSWTVRAGERWAALGPNGSGKSTLLSLICADHPQAYSNDVRLFGRRRGTGETIWEVKQRIGLVSPELHLYFTQPLTAAATAATGFFDVVTARATMPEQDAIVRELFEQFQIGDLADRPFARLSTGEQRLVLFIRALVKRPPLLILDEPFQAMDSTHVSQCRDWLDRELHPEQTLLFVTHLLEEIPHCVDRILRLNHGRALF